jgi:excisionase family DNA binding protein
VSATTISRDDLLTRAEVAALLGLKTQTVAKWALSGKHLPVVRIGGRIVRYKRSDVERLLDKSVVGVAEAAE